MTVNRKQRVRASIGVVLAAGAITGLAWGLPWGWSEWQESRLETAMTQGGYVIYLRHADRAAGAKEALNARSEAAAFEDCSGQRNLTAEGREDAVAVGRVFARLGIPIGRVVALPLCRTRDTAFLAFGRAQLDARLYDPAYVAEMLATMPDAGTNMVVVDTEDQVRTLAGVSLKPGEVAVFAPDGAGGFHFVGVLDQDDLDG